MEKTSIFQTPKWKFLSANPVPTTRQASARASATPPASGIFLTHPAQPYRIHPQKTLLSCIPSKMVLSIRLSVRFRRLATNWIHPLHDLRWLMPKLPLQRAWSFAFCPPPPIFLRSPLYLLTLFPRPNKVFLTPVLTASTTPSSYKHWSLILYCYFQNQTMNPWRARVIYNLADPWCTRGPIPSFCGGEGWVSWEPTETKLGVSVVHSLIF